MSGAGDNVVSVFPIRSESSGQWPRMPREIKSVSSISAGSRPRSGICSSRITAAVIRSRRNAVDVAAQSAPRPQIPVRAYAEHGQRFDLTGRRLPGLVCVVDVEHALRYDSVLDCRRCDSSAGLLFEEANSRRQLICALRVDLGQHRQDLAQCASASVRERRCRLRRQRCRDRSDLGSREVQRRKRVADVDCITPTPAQVGELGTPACCSAERSRSIVRVDTSNRSANHDAVRDSGATERSSSTNVYRRSVRFTAPSISRRKRSDPRATLRLRTARRSVRTFSRFGERRGAV